MEATQGGEWGLRISRYGKQERENYTEVICYPALQVHSNGVWTGENILHYRLPLVLLQISTVIIVSRIVQLLLKPLRQPAIVSDAIGGIIFGPSVLGRFFPRVRTVLFPQQGAFVGQTLSWVGVIYFAFSNAVKMDFTILVGRGRNAVVIGIVSICFPFLAVLSLSFLLHNYTVNCIAGGPFMVGMAASIALSPFLVVYQFLFEFQLLSSELGRLSLAIALLSDLLSWTIILYVDANVSGHFVFQDLFYQIGSLVFVALLMLLVIRPMLLWVIRRTPQGKQVQQGYVVAILLGALLMAVGSDAIGLSVLEGPIFLGIVVPDGPPLGSTITEKTDTLCRTIFLPLFFYYIGQRFNVLAITDWSALRVAIFLLVVNRLTKFSGTIVATIGCSMTVQEALTLGLILNSRGFMDFIVYALWDHYRLIDAQTYSALVASAILTTTIVSPLVRKMCDSSRRYKPLARRTIQHTKPLTELRLLTCIHDEDSVPTILKLLQVTNATTENPVCIYVLHLMELAGRAAPLLIAHQPNFMNNSGSRSNAIFGAFYNLQQHSNRTILVQPFISISPFSTIHDDICSLALQKKVSLIIVPFHKRLSVAGSLDVVDYALQICNPNILTHAPCSVGILVDRGCLNGRFGGATTGSALYRIGVFFLGGADDREALSYATRMVQHPSAVLTVTRFVSDESNCEEMNSKEKHLDDELVSEFRRKSSGDRKIAYREKVVRDGEDTINAICSIVDVYDLIVVGRCQYWRSSELVQCLSLWSENPELGVIGDLCCSSDFFSGKASVLVMQQQARAAASVYDVIDSKRV